MGSSVAFWGDNPRAWDTLYINGTALQGIAKVIVKRNPRLERRKPPKFHKAVLVDQGDPGAYGTIELTIGFNSTGSQPYGTAAEQWTAWLKFHDEVFGRKSKTRDAYSVEHPEFQIAGISKVFLEDPGSMEGSGPGVRKIVIPWNDYGKIYPASVGTGTGGSVGPVKPKKSTSLDSLPKPSSSVTP